MKRKTYKLACIGLLFYALEGGSATLAAGSQIQARRDMDSGIAYYSAGQYELAAPYFLAAVKLEPNLTVAHYYFANSLSQLKRTSEALTEYQICYYQSPPGKMRDFCHVALEAYATPQEPTTPREPQEDLPTLEAPTSPVSPDVDKAVSVISKQADLMTSNAEREWTTRAKEEIASGEQRARALKDESEERVRTMQSATIKIDREGHLGAQYTAEEIAAVREQYERGIAAELQRSRHGAELKAQFASKLSEETRLEVLSLKTQLMSNLKTPPGTPHLQPVGTNLYVRMYAKPDFHPGERNTQIELVATQDKLVLDESTTPGTRIIHVVPGAQTAEQGQLTVHKQSPPSPNTNLNVQGRLLHL